MSTTGVNYGMSPAATYQQATPTTATGPRAKCDQVIYEAICKACEVIVGSRTISINNNTRTAATTARFNLQIPQVPAARQILSGYRLQLEALPVRLDVYYQDAASSNNRQLLERWCLEYAPLSSDSANFWTGTGNHGNNDPMVQLTQVCKRIVLWLRTLYCWTRLLPAQSAAKSVQLTGGGQIGFSIYVHADGSDDVSELQSQGFLSSQEQLQQHASSSTGNTNAASAVATPYGTLTWQVLYCPALERILPPQRTLSVRIQTPPRPVPHPQQSQKQTTMWAPKSAPTRPMTFTERSQQKRQQASQQQQQRNTVTRGGGGKSYDPSRLYTRSNTNNAATGATAAVGGLQRSNTGLGTVTAAKSPPIHSADNPPERVMSGLSLALMMASNEDDTIGTGEDTLANNNNNEKAAPDNNNNNTKDLEYEDYDDDAVVVEQDDDDDEGKNRRVALHQMAPHLLEQQQQQPVTAAAGEYGYGYNNHIPWQKIQPSTTNPSVVVQQQHQQYYGRTLSTSPSSTIAFNIGKTPQTPPGAAFLGTTPPRSSGGGGGTPGSFISSNSNLLIPPRRSSSGSCGADGQVTPPFPPRPAGFWHEDPPASVLEDATATAQQGTPTSGQDGRQVKSPAGAMAQPKEALSSLDQLRSSPFQQQQPMLSMATADGASAMLSLSYAPSSDFYASSNIMTNSGDLRKSLWSGGGTTSGRSATLTMTGPSLHHHQPSEDYSTGFTSEDMPFAVELSESPKLTGSQIQQQGGGTATNKSVSGSSMHTSSFLGNSASVASLAQKCSAPSHRLKLFEKQAAATNSTTTTIIAEGEVASPADGGDHHDLAVSSLADQLQEFRAFGASLHGLDSGVPQMSGDAADQLRGSSGSSTTTPPIPLRS